MTVTEALNSRLSVRDFLPTPVTAEQIRRVLATASRSPSGGNVQPWQIDVVAGDKLAELKALMQRRLAEVAAGDKSESPEYDIYPKELVSPHRDYRFKIGEDMYARLGIPREDKPARLRWFARNYQFFGAPMALFCSVDRRMGPPQWSDLGMFLQSVMLLLREEGLDSCPQECWVSTPRPSVNLSASRPSACCSPAWRSASATPSMRSTSCSRIGRWWLRLRASTACNS